MSQSIRQTNCISCNTVSGTFQPPGSTIYENEHWLFVLRAKPLRTPCYGFIILKRHCEHVHELTVDESAALGKTMRLVAQVVTHVIQPAKIHFGLYAEEVKHLHVHVFPRMPKMPVGNIPNVWWNVIYRLLARLGLKPPYSDEGVAAVAARLRLEIDLIIRKAAD